MAMVQHYADMNGMTLEAMVTGIRGIEENTIESFLETYHQELDNQHSAE